MQTNAKIAGSAENSETDVQWNDQQKKQVEDLWNMVFANSNRVLQQHKYYGFEGVKAMPNPNVHVMVTSLKILGGIMDVLLNTDAPYEQSRQLLNAKKQITSMEQLALALLANNDEDYQQALDALDKQAPF